MLKCLVRKIIDRVFYRYRSFYAYNCNDRAKRFPVSEHFRRRFIFSRCEQVDKPPKVISARGSNE